MSDKFRGKYRNGTARLQSWDYGSAAAYFITICTKDREHYFGEIQNGKMHYSPAGALAYTFWQEIKNHTDHIELGEFVVMPNHVHGILILGGDDEDSVRPRHALDKDISIDRTDVAGNVPTKNDKMAANSDIVRPRHALDQPNPIGQDRFQNQGKKTISSIVGSYKSAVTKYCNRLELPNGWQPRFHDHIIRDDKSFQTISQYIIRNPQNWKEDDLFG